MSDPVQVSETIQEFEGTRYYLCDKYFQNNGVRLHRMVWQAANGEIPDGCHVHHDNEDRSDNRLSNLVLLTAKQHLSLHMSTPEAKARSAASLEPARNAAAEWHGSAEGKEWHKQQYAKHCKGKINAKFEKTCERCSNQYQGTKPSRFCSNKCKAAARRDSGIDNVERECVICGTEFSINKYFKTVTCSRSCGATFRWQERNSK